MRAIMGVLKSMDGIYYVPRRCLPNGRMNSTRSTSPEGVSIQEVTAHQGSAGGYAEGCRLWRNSKRLSMCAATIKVRTTDNQDENAPVGRDEGRV